MPRYIEGFEGGNFGITSAPGDYLNIENPLLQESGVIHKDNMNSSLLTDLGGGYTPSVNDLQQPRHGNYVCNIGEAEALRIPVTTIFGQTRSVYLKFRMQAYNQLNTELVQIWCHNPASYSTPIMGVQAYYGDFYLTQNSLLSTYNVRSRQCITECQWYLFEMYLNLSTNSTTYDGEYEIRIDGNTILKETNCRTNNFARPEYISFITLKYISSAGYHLFIDDIAIDSTNCLDIKSNGKIIRFEPSSDGSLNMWTPDRTGSDLVGNFYASYNESIDADASLGDPTGIPYGGADVSNGYLDLGHDDLRYVTYDGTNTLNFSSSGCVRFKLFKQYPGTSPSNSQLLFYIYDSTSSLNENRIQLWQGTNRYFYFRIYDTAGNMIVNSNFGAITLGDYWMEIEVNWDLINGEHRLYIDGTQRGSTLTGTGTRNPGDRIRIGNAGPIAGSNNSYFWIDDFIIYNDVQHTGSSYLQTSWGEIFASGSEHYDYVDDKWKRHQFMDYTWLETNNMNQYESFNISMDATSTISNVYHVQYHIRSRKFGTSPEVTSITPYLRSGGSNYELSTHFPLPMSIYEVLVSSMETNPITSSAWQPSDLSTFEIGFRSPELPI